MKSPLTGTKPLTTLAGPSAEYASTPITPKIGKPAMPKAMGRPGSLRGRPSGGMSMGKGRP